jgi:hypothetical protein
VTRRFVMRVPRLRSQATSDIVDAAGLGCLVAAAWWWQPIVGLVCLGVALLLAGWALSR